MSLINDALRRAEEEKLRRTTPSPKPADLPRGPRRPRRWDRRPSPKPWLVIGALLCAAAAGIFCFVKHTSRAVPQGARAEAVAQPATPIVHAPPKVEISPETERIFAKTIDAVEYYHPRPHPAPATQPAAGSMSAAGESVAKRAAEASAKPKQPASAPAPVKKAVIRVEPKTIVSPIDRSRYKLSAIVQGDRGAMAVINNTFVRVGDTIDGAKVIAVRSSSVELEIDGQRFNVGM